MSLLNLLGAGKRGEGGWWLSGGISSGDVYGAWSAMGGISLADSYIDLSGNGNALSKVGAANATIDSSGWDFSTGLWALDTGYIPGDMTSQARSLIVRFTGGTYGNSPAGCHDTAARFEVLSSPLYGNGDKKSGASALYSGVLCVAGSNGYADGVSDVTEILPYPETMISSAYIGARNLRGGTVSVAWPGSVQAVAIYTTVITADQVAAVTMAMVEL